MRRSTRKKLDGVEHCRGMLENVRQDHPQLEQAAECRYLSTVCNILFQIRDKAHEPERKLLWKEVVAAAARWCRGHNARKKRGWRRCFPMEAIRCCALCMTGRSGEGKQDKGEVEWKKLRRDHGWEKGLLTALFLLAVFRT